MSSTSKKRIFGKPVMLAVAAALAISLAACSGDTDSGSSDKTGKTGKTTSDQAAADAAAERLAPLTEPVTDIGITTPLDGVPDPGKLVYFIHFNNAAATPSDPYFNDAVKALGWTPKILVTDASDPQGTSNAMTQAVAAGADYITLNSTNLDAIGPGMDAAKAAGVPVFFTSSVGDVGGAANGLYGSVNNEQAIAGGGKALMDWAISDSGGATSVLWVTYPDAPILAVSGPLVEKSFTENCPKCSLSVLQVSTDQVVNGDMVSPIVSEIRKNPDIKYVTMDISLAANGLREALDSAGLSDVKIGVGYPPDDMFQGVRDGEFAVIVPSGIGDAQYASVDQMARVDLGMDPDQASHAVRPIPMFNADNISDLNTWAGPDGFEDQYLALWGKS